MRYVKRLKKICNSKFLNISVNACLLVTRVPVLCVFCWNSSNGVNIARNVVRGGLPLQLRPVWHVLRVPWLHLCSWTSVFISSATNHKHIYLLPPRYGMGWVGGNLLLGGVDVAPGSKIAQTNFSTGHSTSRGVNSNSNSCEVLTYSFLRSN